MDSSNSELIDLLYAGSYEPVVSQASKASPDLDSDDDPTVRRFLLVRAYAAQGKWEQAEAEVKRAAGLVSTPDHTALSLLVAYQRARVAGDTSAVLISAEAALEANTSPSPIQIFALASIFAGEARYSEALLLVGQAPEDIDCVVLKVSIHLRMHRVELAQKVLDEARDWAEDRLPFQLATAWKDLFLSGDSYQEAFFSFEEISSSSSTPSALNGQIAASLCLGRVQEAQALVAEATTARTVDADLLANGVVASRLSGAKNAQEQADAFYKQLVALAPRHPLVLRTKEVEEKFEAAAARFATAAN